MVFCKNAPPPTSCPLCRILSFFSPTPPRSSAIHQNYKIWHETEETFFFYIWLLNFVSLLHQFQPLYALIVIYWTHILTRDIANVWIITYEAGNMAISDPQIALECLLVDAHCNIIGASLVTEAQKLSCTKNGDVKSFFVMTSSCLPFFIFFFSQTPSPLTLSTTLNWVLYFCCYSLPYKTNCR